MADVMATLIWVMIWGWLALVGSIAMIGATKLFIFKEPKEDVIEDIHDLIVGGVEELD
jgi:hypothetical protein